MGKSSRAFGLDEKIHILHEGESYGVELACCKQPVQRLEGQVLRVMSQFASLPEPADVSLG